MPASDIYGLTPGAKVTALEAKQTPPGYGKPTHPWRRVEDRAKHLPVGEGLLGRVLDGSGRPLDKLGPLRFQAQAPLQSRPVNPIDREPIGEPLDVGVRAINALLTVGRGQRMGLFAGSGVGKSVLLGMMARYTSADVIVVGLIGERGREVKEFIENILGEKGLPAPWWWLRPPMRRRCCVFRERLCPTTIAEYFRTQGKHACYDHGSPRATPCATEIAPRSMSRLRPRVIPLPSLPNYRSW
jgi:flagellum-specific ATP synthase